MTIVDAVKLSAGQISSRSHDKIFGILALTQSVLIPSYDMPTIILYFNVLVEGLLELKAEETQTNSPHIHGTLHVYDFVEALLAKMELSSLHATTALITMYAHRICDTSLSPMS